MPYLFISHWRKTPNPDQIKSNQFLLLNGAPLGHPVLEAALVVVDLGESHLLQGSGGLSGTPAHHSVCHYDRVGIWLGEAKLVLEGVAVQLEGIGQLVNCKMFKKLHLHFEFLIVINYNMLLTNGQERFL